MSKELQAIALKNILRSLKEGGRLLLMYPVRHDAYDVVEQVIQTPKWSSHFVSYPPPREFISEEQYRGEILSQLPFWVNLEKTEIPCYYESDEEMQASINCWLSHVDQIPEDKRKEFLVDVAEAYKRFRELTEPTMYYSSLIITGTSPKLTISSAPKAGMFDSEMPKNGVEDHVSFQYDK